MISLVLAPCLAHLFGARRLNSTSVSSWGGSTSLGFCQLYSAGVSLSCGFLRCAGEDADLQLYMQTYTTRIADSGSSPFRIWYFFLVLFCLLYAHQSTSPQSYLQRLNSSYFHFANKLTNSCKQKLISRQDIKNGIRTIWFKTRISRPPATLSLLWTGLQSTSVVIKGG